MCAARIGCLLRMRGPISPRRAGPESTNGAVKIFPAPGSILLPHHTPGVVSNRPAAQIHRVFSLGMLGRSAVGVSSCKYSVSCSPSLDTSVLISNLVLLPARSSSCGSNHIVHASETQSYRCYLKCTVRKWRLNSVEQIQPVLLEDDHKKTWEECKEILCSLSFSAEEADTILKKAFGWVHSPYWGEERRKEVPRRQIVDEVLGYLKDLGLNDEDRYKLLKKFPEVLGCSLADEVRTNISLLEKDWGIKGKALRNLLLRNPKVLGYNVDCKGDCMAQCTRCWVRF